MREFIISAFDSYGAAIVYIHVVGSVLFIGSLFAVQFLCYSPIESVSDEEERYTIFLKVLRRFFIFSCIVLPMMIFAAILMDVGLNLKYGNPIEQAMVNIKESVWILIVLNLAYMYRRYLNAKEAFGNNLLIATSENIKIIMKYLMPLTFIFGLVAILFGSIVRGH